MATRHTLAPMTAKTDNREKKGITWNANRTARVDTFHTAFVESTTERDFPTDTTALDRTAAAGLYALAKVTSGGARGPTRAVDVFTLCMSRRPIRPLLIAIVLVTVATATSATAATIAAQIGDATIAHDTASGTWALSSAGATLTLALDASRDFSVLSLTSPSGKPWTTAPAVDTF